MLNLIYILTLLFSPVRADLDTYSTLLAGTFSSKAQAAYDSTYDDVTIHILPIYPESTIGRWFYTEQYDSSSPIPYRQRVYHIIPQGNTLLQYIYTIPDTLLVAAATYRHTDIVFPIAATDLRYKDSCDIVLLAFPFGYTGQTPQCPATFRGSSYSISSFLVTIYGIQSWERGYTRDNRHVWGHPTGPYHFLRLSFYARVYSY